MLRYRGLGYVALNVTDLKRSRPFYEDTLGLLFDGEGSEGELFFRSGGGDQSVVLYRGDRPGLKRIGWELENETQIAALAEILDRRGASWRELSPRACHAMRVGRGIRVVEANTSATFDFFAGFVTRSAAPYTASVGKIQRLGHVVLRTPSDREAVDFCKDALNFRASDEIKDFITFLRCFPNPYHHSLGIAKARRSMLHHVNFMVSEVDDVYAAAARFRKNRVPIMFGPGRHAPSGSVFLYFLDPDGLTLEYSHGMEQFEEMAPRAPRVLPPTAAKTLDEMANKLDPRVFAVGDIEKVAMGE